MDKMPSYRKWLFSSVILLLAVLSTTSVVDQRAAADYEKLFQRAFVTFALARTINGVISVVQGTEVALQPAGVGVTLTPGEILDPVNDLVERFSWIMLGATVSLGVQSVLLDIGAWWVLQVLLVGLATWLVVRVWYPDNNQRLPGMLLKRLFILLLFVRFAVPLMLVANDLLYQQFLEPRFEQSTQIITTAGRDLEKLHEQASTETPNPAESGLLDSITSAWGNTISALDLSGKLSQMQQRAGEIIEHMVQLSVVFIFQTGLLPVAFLWLFLQLVKWLFQSMSRAGRVEDNRR